MNPSPPPPTQFYSSRCSQSPGLTSFSHRANSHGLSILHMVVCISHATPSIHPSFLLPPSCPQVCSLCPHLQRCPATGSSAILASSRLHRYALICGTCFSLAILIIHLRKNHIAYLILISREYIKWKHLIIRFINQAQLWYKKISYSSKKKVTIKSLYT